MWQHFLAERARSFYSNCLPHIHAIPNIHGTELPSASTDTSRWPLSSFSGALLIHPPLLSAASQIYPFIRRGFHKFFLDVVLLTFKKAGVIHQATVAAAAHVGRTAHCGYSEPQRITTVVSLIGEVSPVQEGGMIKM